LTLEPLNISLKKVSTSIEERKKARNEIARKKKVEQDRKDKEKWTLVAAIRAREIRMRKSSKPPELEDASIHLSPDPLSPESHLVFPVVFLYPTHAQSDFIKAFHETEDIADHLKYILPLPWDSSREYNLSSVSCYMETISGGLIKVGKKMSLLKILSSGKVEIVDDLVKINVVPIAKAEKWVEEMKARAAATKPA
jgi:hypothetical protein